MELVLVRNLQHTYPDGSTVSLEGPDFTVGAGQRVAVLGANGSGKTTLLHHIMGLLKPSGGKVEVFGLDPNRNFRRLRRRLGVVLQRVEEQLLGPTVFDDAAFALRNQGCSQPEVERRVREMLQEMGISHLGDKVPHYLSGGEKKKVALAGAMILNPPLLLLDEPLDGLDPFSRQELIQLLLRLNREHGTSLIIATHDVDIVTELADVVYVLGQGRIMAVGTPAEVFSRAEVLREAKLAPPALTTLFHRLQAAGVPVSLPLTLGEAEASLTALFRRLGG
ncbi:MAG TPA: ATP-binding cassette domain-containing protein [Firmicutes bacterium]|nr:ATP-binding cassette domain-containing protein [Bacillota bacterium]